MMRTAASDGQRDCCHMAIDEGFVGPGAPSAVSGSLLRMMLSNEVKLIGLQKKLIMATYKVPIGLC